MEAMMPRIEMKRLLILLRSSINLCTIKEVCLSILSSSYMTYSISNPPKIGITKMTRQVISSEVSLRMGFNRSS